VDLATAGIPVARSALPTGRVPFQRDAATYPAQVSRILIGSADFLPYRNRLLRERRKTQSKHEALGTAPTDPEACRNRSPKCLVLVIANTFIRRQPNCGTPRGRSVTPASGFPATQLPAVLS